MKLRMVIFVAIVCFLIGGIGGYILRPQVHPHADTEVRLSGYRFINPLLECEQSADYLQTMLVNFRNRIRSVVQSHIDSGDVSDTAVYFRDLNNGPWFGIKDTMQFSPASLLKIPLLMTYLQQVDTDPTLLSKVITYQVPVDYDKDQTIVPQTKLEIGKQYSMEQLLNYMTEYSSNNATYFLYNYLDKKITDQVYLDLGLMPPTGSVDSYTISVKGYASFFRILFNASYLSRTMSERALSIMSQSSYNDALVAGVPRSVVVSHKFGERYFAGTGERQLHDCGIVYYPKHPYLLCIMTRGKNMPSLVKTIADISGQVYQEVDRQLQAK